MKKIAFITHNLCLGGVQKNVALLANTLSNIYAVTIILFESKEVAYALDKSIALLTLPQHTLHLADKNDLELEFIGMELFDIRSRELGALLKEASFDLVIAFEDYNSLCTLHTLPKKSKAIVSSRVSLEYGYKDRLIHLLPRSFYETHIKALYPKAEAVVSVSEGVGEELAKLGIASVSIANGIEIEKLLPLAQEPIAYEGEFFLHVGRFDTAQKAQDALVHAYAKVSDTLQSSLIFVGDGKDRASVEALVAQYGLEKRIFFMGFDANPYKYMHKCKGFIFSSHYEGMPNALLEALSLGCAVVAYKFEPSWREFDGKEGILFINRGDIESLSLALVRFEKEPIFKVALEQGAQKIIQAYRHDRCQQQWVKLVNNVVSKEACVCAES
jgi:glycosyltransferase involved in cell wall biosynthesis